jgi:hypothetical protein
MAFVHGKGTFVSLAGTNLSTYVTTSNFERVPDEHDVTTYGKNSHAFNGGLLNGTATISGIYDNAAVSGPRALIAPLIGTVVEYIRRPEGTGSGRPQDKVQVLVGKYVESSPVADMVTWSLDLRLSGDVDMTPQ